MGTCRDMDIAIYRGMCRHVEPCRDMSRHVGFRTGGDAVLIKSIQSLCAFRRAALIGVWSVVFWSWGVLGGFLRGPRPGGGPSGPGTGAEGPRGDKEG